MEVICTKNYSQQLIFGRTFIQSTALPAECFICGKGISDGYSVTAKKITGGTALFCSIHYSLQ